MARGTLRQLIQVGKQRCLQGVEDPRAQFEKEKRMMIMFMFLEVDEERAAEALKGQLSMELLMNPGKALPFPVPE